jgi:hypothetical protein
MRFEISRTRVVLWCDRHAGEELGVVGAVCAKGRVPQRGEKKDGGKLVRSARHGQRFRV